jgi:predicted dehydrogenase
LAKARVAVVGTGWWATYAHIPALQKHPEVELVALADRRPEILAKAAQHYGIDRTYTDYRAMLESESLDGAVVAVWHAAHYEVARACLEKDLHLVLEKPMVLQASHARSLCDLARERNREIVMSYPWQFLSPTVRARDLIQSDSLGEIQYAVSIFASGPYPLYKGDDRSENPAMKGQYPVVGPGDVYSDPERSGGGQGHLQVTHSAALLFFITGLQTASVQAQMSNLDVSVDVVDAITARLDNGALATIGSTGAIHGGGGKLDIQIYCSQGWIDLDFIANTAIVHYADGSEESLDPDPADGGDDFQEAAPYLYPADAPANNLVEIIHGRHGNRSPGDIGWRTVELLDAAYRSAAEDGRIVTVASLYSD